MILLPTALKSPAAFHEQRRSLERARVRHPVLLRDLKRALSEPLALLVIFLPVRRAFRASLVSQFQIESSAFSAPSPHPAISQQDAEECDYNEFSSSLHVRVWDDRWSSLLLLWRLSTFSSLISLNLLWLLGHEYQPWKSLPSGPFMSVVALPQTPRIGVPSSSHPHQPPCVRLRQWEQKLGPSLNPGSGCSTWLAACPPRFQFP